MHKPRADGHSLVDAGTWIDRPDTLQLKRFRRGIAGACANSCPGRRRDSADTRPVHKGPRPGA